MDVNIIYFLPHNLMLKNDNIELQTFTIFIRSLFRRFLLIFAGTK